MGRAKNKRKIFTLKELNFKKFFIKPPDLSGLSLGKAGEKWAVFLYKKAGFKILFENYEIHLKKKAGEFDFICSKGKQLVFVEVKTRQDESFMPLEQTITKAKQDYLRRMVRLFFRERREYKNYDPQIDFVGIVMNEIDNSVESVKILENIIEDYE